MNRLKLSKLSEFLLSSSGSEFQTVVPAEKFSGVRSLGVGSFYAAPHTVMAVRVGYGSYSIDVQAKSIVFVLIMPTVTTP